MNAHPMEDEVRVSRIARIRLAHISAVANLGIYYQWMEKIAVVSYIDVIKCVVFEVK